MILHKLQLQDFRSYKKKSLKFSSESTLLAGDNAVGKTNLIEAMVLLATGKSFRAGREVEMIRDEAELARVEGEIEQDEGEKIKLEVILTRGEVQGRKVYKKRLLVNGLAKRLMDFAGRLRVVLFQPDDLRLVLGSPSRRRNYLDFVLIQLDREYYRSLLVYEKGLRRRNKLLCQIREREGSLSQLEYWDRLLVKNGQILHETRKEFLKYINQNWLHNQLVPLKGLQVEYDDSSISFERLKRYQREEIASGTTLVGPHRDDFKILTNDQMTNKDLAVYGSRGEQRMSVLALKLAELAFVREKTGENPLLLLDDIFSELDHEHRGQVLSIVSNQQTVITTTEIDLVEKKFRDKMRVIVLNV